MSFMNSLVGGLNKVADAAIKNSPAILTFLGISGMVTTVVIACEETPKALQIIEDIHSEIEYSEMLNSEGEITDEQLKKDIRDTYVDYGKDLIKTYFPAFCMGAVSIGCIICSYNITNKRVAALATAYSITENAFNEYKGKVVETFGKNKEKKVREAIAQDKLQTNPVESTVVFETGRGNTLILEPLTGRYYHGNIDDIYKAQDKVIKRIVGDHEMIDDVDHFFEEMGFYENAPKASLASLVGWNWEHLPDIRYRSGIATNGEPCLVIDYLTEPMPDYI